MTAINSARSFAYRNRDASIRLEERDRDALVRCHTPALRHAFAEIITNALNFSPEGREITISQWRASDSVWVSVVDAGPGIPEDQLERALQDYQQIDRESGEQQGMGLGLPLARRLLEVHGGTIELRSVVGKGTQVTIMLPTLSDEE
jgi:signal transduction histidine kinase